MQLLFLFILIVGAYALSSLARGASRSLRGRIAAALFFVFTGLAHFAKTQEMAQMLPSFVPARTEIIYLTGVLEILGAIGLLIPATRKYAAWCLILFLIAVLPSNIYSALERIDFGGHGSGPVYLLLRIPFQIFVIAWIYYFGIWLDQSPKVKSVSGGL
jgi:uncharacterized membrane protein